jgi:hypothetical protein
MPFQFEEDVAHLPPFELALLLAFVLGTVEGNDQLGIIAIDSAEIEVEVGTSQFRLVVPIVEDAFAPELLRKVLGHLRYEGTFLTGE